MIRIVYTFFFCYYFHFMQGNNHIANKIYVYDTNKNWLKGTGTTIDTNTGIKYTTN